MRLKERPNTGRARRPRLIGPGMILAAAVAFVVWQNMPPVTDATPRIERTQITSTKSELISAPEPGWLMKRKRELGLNPEQSRQFDRLKSRWDKDTADLRSGLTRAEAEFESRMKAGEGGTNLQQLQEWSAPISELSGQLSQARRAWWEDAAAYLTPEQRRKAESLWIDHLKNGNTNRKDAAL